MSGSNCESMPGLLAMDALGRLDEHERAELADHLATCEECRATRDEFASTVEALDQWAGGASPAPVAVVAPHLAQAVLAGIGDDDQRVERGHRVRRVAVACVSIAAVVLAALLFAAQVTRSEPRTRTVALRGTAGVTATAMLQPKEWGTALQLVEHGLPPGRTYTVSMATSEGRWWIAGSYRATSDGPVRATMACAASFGSITDIRVTDSSGNEVLRTAGGPDHTGW